MPLEPAHAATDPGPTASARVGRFEQLPKWLNLIPMVLQWIWLGIRYRSISLPSTANPGITSGGMVGDGKLEYFAAMGETARAATADHIGVLNQPGLDPSTLIARMRDAGLQFPVVAKPDMGWCGYGVRLLASAGDLSDYLRRFPQQQTFLLQRYLPDPGEAGLFYMREPDAPTGRLIGILLRHYPSVTGNGIDTVATLIAGDVRLRRATANADAATHLGIARLQRVPPLQHGACRRGGANVHRSVVGPRRATIGGR